MSKQRDDRILLADILEAVQSIQEFVRGYTYEQFKQDKKTVDAVVRNFEIIGEATRILGSTVKAEMAAIPWAKIQGLRNRVIHEYFNVSREIIWFVIQNELQPLAEGILEYLDSKQIDR